MGAERGKEVQDTALWEWFLVAVHGKCLGLVRPRGWKKVTMASVQEQCVEFRNASRSYPPGFVSWWLSATKPPSAELLSPRERNLCEL